MWVYLSDDQLREVRRRQARSIGCRAALDWALILLLAALWSGPFSYIVAVFAVPVVALLAWRWYRRQVNRLDDRSNPETVVCLGCGKMQDFGGMWVCACGGTLEDRNLVRWVDEDEMNRAEELND